MIFTCSCPTLKLIIYIVSGTLRNTDRLSTNFTHTQFYPANRLAIIPIDESRWKLEPHNRRKTIVLTFKRNKLKNQEISFKKEIGSIKNRSLYNKTLNGSKYFRQWTIENQRERHNPACVISTTAGRELKVSTAIPVASICIHTDSTWPGHIVKKRGRESRRSSLVILSRVSTDGVCEVWSSFFGEILGVKEGETK